MATIMVTGRGDQSLAHKGGLAQHHSHLWQLRNAWRKNAHQELHAGRQDAVGKPGRLCIIVFLLQALIIWQAL